ncbi:ArnT family glycosyltransferase [Stratiformator vulcanicus]|uniref:Undecaprenyl phosphate-alpha-4-amino-4-deoxy-L-arabinose arabinosyl transferase n=1 Tax=Stratiformator vulcanicus TaxID=2527980 RepID=A0A517QZS3_9PLAN|nr:glycosyltransferase family 39 protein [Stratiformator vulcanicus]QDT37145.1 Undecaprenyl phosphate-alpha-4-amino-4-deoxy-L-arabinose arabinosyl transferase [Stratiformator vulcanicus]
MSRATVRRDLLLLSLLAGTVFFFDLGGADLFDDDEPKNAGCAAEMYARGDWLVPTFNGELRLHKPILLYWFMLTSYHMFGVTEFAARFFSAFFAVGTVLLTYDIGRRLFDRSAGLWSAVALATSPMFVVVARAANPDSVLIFPITLAFWAYLRLILRQNGGVLPDGQTLKTGDPSDSQDAWKQLIPRGWTMLLPYSAMAVAVLAKGPIGFVMPCGVLGLFIYLRSLGPQTTSTESSFWSAVLSTIQHYIRPVQLVRVALAMRPDLLILALLVIASPWYIAVGIATEGEWLAGFLGRHNVGRFLKPMEGHGGSPLYYVVAIIAGTFPWSVLPFPIAWQVARDFKAGDRSRTSHTLVLCWVGVFVVFFTLARTKLPNYVLPCYPAVALVIGRFFSIWLTEATSLPVWTRRAASVILVTAGVGMAVVLPIVAVYVLPGQEYLGLIGLIPIASGIVFYRLSEAGRFNTAKQSFAVSCVVFVTAIFWLAAPGVSRQQISRRFVEQIAADRADLPPITVFAFWRPNLVFYSRGLVPGFDSSEALDEYLAENHTARILVRSTDLERIDREITDRYRVTDRTQGFLRQDDVLLLEPANDLSEQELRLATLPAASGLH